MSCSLSEWSNHLLVPLVSILACLWSLHVLVASGPYLTCSILINICIYLLLRCQLSDMSGSLFSMVIILSSLIYRMLIYIFLLLSIIIISYSLFGTMCLISGRFYLLGWPQPLGFSYPSLNLFWSFVITRISVLLSIWMTPWSWFALSRQERGLTHVCVPYWFSLDYILIFPSLTFANCGDCVMSFRVTRHMLTILLLICFLVFNFPSPPYISWNGYLIWNRTCFLCNFYFLMWLLLLFPHLLIEPFIFRDLVYLFWLVDAGQVLYVGLMLPCRSFRPLPLCYMEWPSTYQVRWLPCMWITAMLKLICVIKVVQFLLFFPGWPASLTNKHGITLILAYIPTHLNVEASYLSWAQILSEWNLLPQVTQAAFHLWGLPEVDLQTSAHSSQWQRYNTLESPLTLGALGMNAFNHPWMFQASYVSSPPLVPLILSRFLLCWMEAAWLPTVLNMLADIPQWCPIIKDHIVDVSIGQALKGLPYLDLTLWLLSDVCYADREFLLQSVR